MPNIDIAVVLDKIRPGAAWRMSDTYENLRNTWEDKQQTLPTEEEISVAWVDLQKAQALAALDAEYQPQFASLAQSLGLATLDGNQANIDSIKEDYAALKTEYQTKREAITGGN